MANLHGTRLPWRGWPVPVAAFCLGLVIGPFVASALGWQVPRGTVRWDVHHALVREESAMCALRARAATANLTDLSFDRKVQLAKRYARFPWHRSADADVVDACANRLADSVPDGQAAG